MTTQTELTPAPAVAARRSGRKWTVIRWSSPPVLLALWQLGSALGVIPQDVLPAKIERVRRLAEERGRKVRFGIRLHTISRDTSAAAWAVADELLAELSPEQIAKQTELHAKSESEGQRRMTALHGGRIDQLEIYPNLWAGVGLVRGGAGTALVGSHEEVANLIYEYHSLGFDEFILSGYPHLEEAYWFAEGVLPLLRQKGVA